MNSSIQVNLLFNKKRNFQRHLHPVYSYRNQLSERGINAHFYTDVTSSDITDCDLLIFFEADYRNILPTPSNSREDAATFLEAFASRFPKVIWFDDRDCAGNLRTYVFPFVTAYAKAQLTRDRGYYIQDIPVGAPHYDYAVAKHGVPDNQVRKDVLNRDDIEKLRLGWNLGLVNWSYMSAGRVNKFVQGFFPNRGNRLTVIPPKLQSREIDVTCRVGMWPQIPAVNWWRSQTVSRLKELKELNVKCDGRIKFAEYQYELQNSIVCASPFGNGEVCYRDFEAFLSGSLLLKPSMDHLETFPNLYVEGETYIAHKWDFSDFGEKVRSICANPAKYEEIAREGQRRFVDAVQNGLTFSEHFERLVRSV